MYSIIVLYFVNASAQVSADRFGTFTDTRDGKVYRTIKMGEQIWFAENLAYRPNSGKYYAPKDDTSLIAKAGCLYEFKTTKTVVPHGWHLPTKKDWEILIKNSGNNETDVYDSLIATKVFYVLLAGLHDATDGFMWANKATIFWSASPVNGDALSTWVFQFYRDDSSRLAKMMHGNNSSGNAYYIRCLKNDDEYEKTQKTKVKK